MFIPNRFKFIFEFPAMFMLFMLVMFMFIPIMLTFIILLNPAPVIFGILLGNGVTLTGVLFCELLLLMFLYPSLWALTLCLFEFLFLMTSVLRESGRIVPCNLRKRPHALHRVFPLGPLRQSGVLVVPQLLHLVIGLAASFAGTEEDILEDGAVRACV
jgi:hypothetical protein